MSTHKDGNWHSETLPTWCAVEAYRRDDQYDWSFRVGIRCRDADVKILDISPRVMHEPGRTPRISMTKEALLQAIHEQVTVELAKLALEKE